MMLVVALIVAEAVEPLGIARWIKKKPLGKGQGMIVRLVGVGIGIAVYIFMFRRGK
jgi:hypothetical protein